MNVSNFADDTTPFVCDLNLEVSLTQIEESSELVIAWFQNNYMKLNTDKCHLLVARDKFEQTWVRVGQNKIWEDQKTLWPLFMDGIQLPQGYSHFEEAVYFLPFSSHNTNLNIHGQQIEV